MNYSKGWAIVCLLGVMGCTYEEHADDCEDGFGDHDDDDGFGKGAAPSGKGGSASSGAAAGTGKGSAASPSEGGTTSTPPKPPEPPVSCSSERECAPGYNCDPETSECTPAEQETCGELESEQACTNRNDCVPIYGGTNCSCGQDCECKGGEPGCVCESFQFFVCQPAE